MYDGDELELYAWKKYCDDEDAILEDEGTYYERVDIEQNNDYMDLKERDFETWLHSIDDEQKICDTEASANLVNCSDDDIEDLFRNANNVR